MARWIIGLLLISSTAYASEDWNHPPRIVTEKPSELCKFIQQKTCNTKRNRGAARCEAWHKEQAAKLGANTVSIVTLNQQGRAGPRGGLFVSDTDTSMTADYLFCPE